MPTPLLGGWAAGGGDTPAALLGGSGCPFATPRMAWFLGQPPVLRVLPVPPQIPWVQPPGAAPGQLVTRSLCACVGVQRCWAGVCPPPGSRVVVLPCAHPPPWVLLPFRQGPRLPGEGAGPRTWSSLWGTPRVSHPLDGLPSWCRHPGWPGGPSSRAQPPPPGRPHP